MSSCPGFLFGRLKISRLFSLLNYNRDLLICQRCYSLNYACQSYFLHYRSRSNTLLLLKYDTNGFTGRRTKYKKSKGKQEDDDSEDDSGEDESDSKLLTGHVTSLRADAVLKAGLGISRNKIEVSFYESRLRLNGKKLLKKSQRVEIGDELDLINGRNVMNEDNLDISRVIVVSANESEDGEQLIIKMKRFKMAVENYEEAPWASS